MSKASFCKWIIHLIKPLLSTFMHLLELSLVAAVAICIALAAHRLFSIDLTAQLVIVLGLVLGGLAKFARTSPDVPVPDYVNDPLNKEVK